MSLIIHCLIASNASSISFFHLFLRWLLARYCTSVFSNKSFTWPLNLLEKANQAFIDFLGIKSLGAAASAEEEGIE